MEQNEKNISIFFLFNGISEHMKKNKWVINPYFRQREKKEFINNQFILIYFVFWALFAARIVGRSVEVHNSYMQLLPEIVCAHA